MAEISDRKLYLGPKLRVLRRELGINQTRMAEELGISPSYLNHLERNQRPLTAQMLLRLAGTYDLDVRDFVAGAGDAAAGNLQEILADPLVRDIAIPRHEVLEVAENYPGVGEAITRLYGALVDLRSMPDALVRMCRPTRSSFTPRSRRSLARTSRSRCGSCPKRHWQACCGTMICTGAG
jgi:XRE family transcriptional regulator, fatty acid utilization regulator